jgi:hypothetical protein
MAVVKIDTVSIESGKKENMAKKLIEALSVRQLWVAKFWMLSLRILAAVFSIPIGSPYGLKAYI